MPMYRERHTPQVMTPEPARTTRSSLLVTFACADTLMLFIATPHSALAAGRYWEFARGPDLRAVYFFPYTQ